MSAVESSEAEIERLRHELDLAQREETTRSNVMAAIQRAIAMRLDLQAMVDLVGDTLAKQFDTGDLLIAWYHRPNNVLNYLYAIEHGQRLPPVEVQPVPGGVFERMIETRSPVVYNPDTATDIATDAGTSR